MLHRWSQDSPGVVGYAMQDIVECFSARSSPGCSDDVGMRVVAVMMAPHCSGALVEVTDFFC